MYSTPKLYGWVLGSAEVNQLDGVFWLRDSACNQYPSEGRCTIYKVYEELLLHEPRSQPRLCTAYRGGFRCKFCKTAIELGPSLS